MNGFSLVELIIVVAILGTLAAVVIPMTANATQQAREAALADNLREVRAAIEKYRMEHYGVPPGFPSGDTTATPTEKTLVAQLTQTTTAEGVIVVEVESADAESDGALADAADTGPSGAATGRLYGPYLAEMPDNPISGSNGVRVLAVGASAAALAADDSKGWVYRPDDGRFQCTVQGKTLDGVSYEDL